MGSGSTVEALYRSTYFTFYFFQKYLQPIIRWFTLQDVSTESTFGLAHMHALHSDACTYTRWQQYKFLLSRQLTSNTNSSKDASYQETIVDPLTSSKSRRQLPVTFISEVQSPSPLLHNNNIGYLLCKWFSLGTMQHHHKRTVQTSVSLHLHCLMLTFIIYNQC